MLELAFLSGFVLMKHRLYICSQIISVSELDRRSLQDCGVSVPLQLIDSDYCGNISIGSQDQSIVVLFISMPLGFPPFPLWYNFAPIRMIALYGLVMCIFTVPLFLPQPRILPKPLRFQYQIPSSRVSFMKTQYYWR